MSPIQDQLIDELKNTIHKLEGRISELEAKVAGRDGGSRASGEGKRLILMGPPGAGMLLRYFEAYKDDRTTS